jgi:hypothetical protein
MNYVIFIPAQQGFFKRKVITKARRGYSIPEGLPSGAREGRRVYSLSYPGPLSQAGGLSEMKLGPGWNSL